MNLFEPKELSIDELDEFYYPGTMASRMGDEDESPMEDIRYDCKMTKERNTFILVGHKGTGKSTELNNLAKELGQEGYPVRVIACAKDVNPESEMYVEILILMAEALISIADELKMELEPHILKFLKEFWLSETEAEYSSEDLVNYEASLEAEIKTPSILADILSVIGKAKADVKNSSVIQKTYQAKIDKRPSQWLIVLNLIAAAIANKRRQPILIFEDLDKLDSFDPQNAWNVFLNRSGFLKDFSFPVIYTFPIALSYDDKFGSIESLYGSVRRLPMIQVSEMNGEDHESGMNAIRSIVEKRADLSLFEEGVLDHAIRMTGGSLRDLFSIIRDASRLSERRGSQKVTMRAVNSNLLHKKFDRIIRIDKNDYPFLMKIYEGEKKIISDKAELLKMIRADIVVEYNGERWHDLHPLIREYFSENLDDIKKMIETDEKQ